MTTNNYRKNDNQLCHYYDNNSGKTHELIQNYWMKACREIG